MKIEREKDRTVGEMWQDLPDEMEVMVTIGGKTKKMRVGEAREKIRGLL